MEPLTHNPHTWSHPAPCSNNCRAAECVFNALEGDSPYHRAVVVVNGNAYFKSCTFRGLSEVQVPETPGVWEPHIGALHVVGLNATMALENCTLTDIVNALPLVVSRGGRVYSDNPDHVVRSHHLRFCSPSPPGSLCSEALNL